MTPFRRAIVLFSLLHLLFFISPFNTSSAQETRSEQSLPEKAAAHIREAQRLAAEGNIEGSIKELFLARELTPENISLYIYIANLYLRLQRLKEAIDILKKGKEVAPLNPEIPMRLAQVYYSAGAYPEAILELKEVIRLAPGTERGEEASKGLREVESRLKTREHFEEAARAIREGRLDDALTATQKVLEVEPGNPFAYFNLGVIETGRKRYEEAIGALKRAIELYPGYVEARYQLGVVYDSMGRFDEAIREYEAAVAVGRGDLEETKKAAGRLKVLRELMTVKEATERVKVLMEAGDLEGALREAERIAAVTEDEKTLVTLGKVYLLRNEFDNAIKTFARVIKINPGNWEAYLLLGQGYEGKRLYREARVSYSKVVSAVPDREEGRRAKSMLERVEVRIHFENAAEYKGKGDIEGAIREIELILELAPDDPVALYNGGVLYHMLEMPERAISFLKKSIEKDPGYIQAYLQLALIYEGLGRYEEAEAGFKTVLSLAKEGREVDIAKSRLGLLKEEEAFSIHMKAAQDFIQEERYEEALKEAQAVIVIAPENYIAHYVTGFIYERLEMFEDAKAAFQKAIEVNPGYASAYLGLARVYEREGFYEEARDAYRKAISTGEGTREAEMGAIGLQRLKKWRLRASMNDIVNSVTATGTGKRTGTASTYGLSFAYDLYKTRKMGFNIGSGINQNIYYESQLTGRGYNANIAWDGEFIEDYRYGMGIGYLYGIFDNKPDYEIYNFSANINLKPDVIPTSLGLGYDYSDITSFVNRVRDAVEHTLSFSISQKISNREDVSGRYSFGSYRNKEPLGSNFAYRSDNLSLKYERKVRPEFSVSGGYNLDLKNYMNPDSTTFFTQFRRGITHGITLDATYRLSYKGSFSLKGGSSWERTNIPSLKAEDLVELGEKQANPIPLVGGWDKRRTITASADLSYQISEKVYLSVIVGNDWVTTDPREAGGYRRLNAGLSVSTLF